MYTPVNPSFTIHKWGVRGSSLHGHVFVMINFIVKIGTLEIVKNRFRQQKMNFNVFVEKWDFDQNCNF